MATAALGHGPGVPVIPQPIVIEENSALMKGLSYIPFIGGFPSLIQELSLQEKIKNTEEVPRLIELINVKNQYKVINGVRSFLTGALMIAGIASGILGGTLVSVAAFVLVTLIPTFTIHQISRNKETITQLESKGFQGWIKYGVE